MCVTWIYMRTMHFKRRISNIADITCHAWHIQAETIYFTLRSMVTMRVRVSIRLAYISTLHRSDCFSNPAGLFSVFKGWVGQAGTNHRANKRQLSLMERTRDYTLQNNVTSNRMRGVVCKKRNYVPSAVPIQQQERNYVRNSDSLKRLSEAFTNVRH